MDPIKISPLVLALTGIAEKNPTSSKSMTESLKIITHDFGFQRAWVRFRMQNGQFADFEANGHVLPEPIRSAASQSFANQERFRLFESDNTHWLTIPLRESGMLIFQRDAAFRIGDQIDDFISYLIVYFNGMIEWHHREETDRELKKNHHLLNQIVNAIPEMLAFKDLSGRYLVVNQKADESFAERFGSIAGKTVEELYPESEVEFIRHLDQEAIQKQGPVIREIQMMTETGNIDVETVSVPVKGEDGSVIGIISMSRDISEKKRTEAQFRRFVAFQDTLMKIATYFINVPESKSDEAIDMALAMAGTHIGADRVYVFDYLVDQRIMNNTYEWCDEGISPEIANLQNVPMDLFLDDWVRPHERGQSVYIADVFGLSPENSLYQVLTPQGIQSVLTIPLIHQDRLLGFVGFDAVRNKRAWSDQDQSLLKVLAELIVNLKIRKEKDAELTQTRLKAEKANEAKSEFLANMSHEIRTPLSGIYNALYLLYNTSLSPEQQEYIDIANASIDSLSGIVNNILDLAKIEAGKMEFKYTAFDLEEELYMIAKMEEYSALEKGLHLLIDMDFEIPRGVVHDRLRLRQILLNLVHNAVKFTEKGYIQLKTKLERLEDAKARIRFEVLDTGIGIPRELLAVITQKFVQGDSSGTKKHAGTGLGLAIVKYLVEEFGGTLSIRSYVGVGSVFSFAFDFAIDPEYPQHHFDAVKGKTVLIVDPIPQVSDHPQRFFASMGMVVQTVTRPVPKPLDFPVDVIVFESSLRDCSKEAIDAFCDAHRLKGAIRALITTEPVPTSSTDPREAGLDLFLSMPTTRQRVYQSLTNRGAQSGIQEAPMPSDWDIDGTFRGIRVLVVDDNRINRQALELILKRSGFMVTLAQNGYEAIDLARKLEFDLILMDIQMPGIDGYETTRKIRGLDHANAKVPIFAVTANALPAAKEQAMASGMNESITKPIKPEQVFRLVEGYLNNRKIHRPHKTGIAVPATIAVFGYGEFVRRFEGMIDLGVQIIEAFQNDMPADLKKIRDASNSNDPEQVRRAVHYFKGSASYVGADRVVWVCQKVLELAKAGTLDGVEDLIILLEPEAGRWKTEVEALIQKGVFR